MNEKVMEKLEGMVGKDLLNELPVIAEHARQADSEEPGTPRKMLRGVKKELNPDEIQILAVDVTRVPDKNTMIGNVWILAGPQIEYLIVQVEMLHNGVCIGRNVYADLKRDTLELHVKGEVSGPVAANELQLAVSIGYKSMNCALGIQEQQYSVDYLLGTDEAVNHLNVIDPRNIRTPIGTTIHVSIDRKEQLQNMVDYDYKTKRTYTNQQPIFLEMKGEIHLNQGYEYIDKSFKTEKIFLTRENRYYEYKSNEAAVEYDKQKNIIKYQYNEDWNAEFYKSVEGTCSLVDYRMLVSFRYKDSAGKEGAGLAIVSSREYNSTMAENGWQPSNYMKIPNILFYWGCLEENTQITMADGSKSRIKDIKIGERVMNIEGQACEVVNIFKGAEQMLLFIRTMSGREILVTRDHPFWTRNGAKAAIDLVYEDELLMEDGSYERIEGAGPIEKYFIVYSLALQPSAFIWGNGFATGDWENQGKAGKVCRNEVSPEVLEELNHINEVLYQAREGEAI